MANVDWKVGHRVQWDGSGDIWSKRIYKGTIIELCDGYAVVEDDGWHARNGVAYTKLQPLEE